MGIVTAYKCDRCGQMPESEAMFVIEGNVNVVSNDTRVQCGGIIGNNLVIVENCDAETAKAEYKVARESVYCGTCLKIIICEAERNVKTSVTGNTSSIR